MEKKNYTTWADILRTIGHPVRIRIIETLLGDGKCVSNIWSCLGLPQSTVSQHLSLLRVKGIVHDERHGSRVKYSISDSRVVEIMRLIKKQELT
jgi:ArsR family transcriptional regulator